MKASSRVVRAWYLYDWANSAFFTTVTVLLGPYLTALASTAADAQGMVFPLGIPVYYQSFWDYVVGFSVILQVVALPIVGAIADYRRKKRLLLGLLTLVGGAAAASLFFLTGSAYLQGGLLFIAANVSFGAAVVVYNSFLPEIAGPNDRDRVSTVGWGIGYLGGGLLLAANLGLLVWADRFGISQAMAVRINLCSGGVWAVLFTIPVILTLRDTGKPQPLPAGQSILGTAFRQFGHTLKDMRRFPETMIFLIGFLIYNDAIQTVLVETPKFATNGLGIPLDKVLLAYLMSQFIGIFGALGFGKVASRIGSKNAIVLSLVIWTGVLIAIYAAVHSTFSFFVVVAAASVVVGGTQALSRSLFAQLVPKGKEAEYFGIYEISDKGTSWMGPIAFGVVLQMSHSYQAAILSLIVFFIVGGALLTRVNVKRGIEAISAAG